jgi:four helix bundle protein
MGSIIKDKSKEFAIMILKFYKDYVKRTNEYQISKQIVRSGTSIGANVREAHNAESDKDFIHKMSIAQKECDETIYWLEIMKGSEYISQAEFEVLNDNCSQLLKIIRTIIISTKKRINKIDKNY